MDTHSAVQQHAQLKTDLDLLTARIIQLEEDNEAVQQVVLKEESASRRFLMQTRLRNNKSVVESARIYLWRASSSFSMKSGTWIRM